MSHLIKIYVVCKFNYFRLWYLKSLDSGLTPFLDSAYGNVQYVYVSCNLIIKKETF